MIDSRSTYRKPAHEVAWQRQLRDRYNDEGAPDGVDLSLKRARVVPVGRGIAQAIILRYEWLGTLGNASRYFGIMFGRHCAGVCCVALSCSGTGGTKVAESWRLPPRDVANLTRGACAHWAPPGANSKLIAWTCRLVAPDARLLIAYSDSDAGEIGTVYQASGWSYVGKTVSVLQYVSAKGRVLDKRGINLRARRAGMTSTEYRKHLIPRGWRTQQSNPKGVYVRVLRRDDEQLLALVARRQRPYPKRAKHSVDAPA